METEQKMGWQRWGVILSTGFFAIAAQTLLFRAFLGVFEGNELGIACFFSSWLVWVAAGAVLARSRLAVMKVVVDHFEFLPLLYIPAYLLQLWLINHARELAGVRQYELFPLLSLLPVTFLGNAPVSLCTGFLFAMACRWVQSCCNSPVARVYTWESAGSVLGGLAVTLLLASGVAAETIFLFMALLQAAMPAVCRLRRTYFAAAAAPLIVAAAVLCPRVAERWERGENLRAWRKVFPEGAPGGVFTTPEAKYLYGEYGDQFNVVANGTVVDTLPATEHASEIVALHLAQRPAARRFLVVGWGGFSVCRRLLELPQADAVTWCNPDAGYRSQLLSRLPERLASGTARLKMPGGDIRHWLGRSDETYDIVILNFPAATTLALNRYFTREFFQLLKGRLAGQGMVGVRVSAGENFMGEDLVNSAASVFATLRSVFPYVVIKPGDESWLIASGSPGLTASPAELRDRFAAVEGAGRIYPPEGLMGLYQPQRAEYELQSFEAAARRTPASLLLNTDRSPRAMMHSLLFAAHEAGGASSFGRLIRTLAVHGLLVLPVGLLLFPLLRTIFRIRSRRAPGSAEAVPVSVFDSHALVFTTGAAGMACVIVMMYLYQAAFGSIFLHIGLISTLFMAGLAIGSAAAASLLSGALSRRRFFTMLWLAFAAQAILCGLVAVFTGVMSRTGFAIAFVVCGMAGGVFVPLAAACLKAAGIEPRAAGTWIEAVDSLGGAAGGMITGLIILPVFGTTYALAIVVILLLVNVAGAGLFARAGTGGTDRFRERARVAGYAIVGVGVFLMAAGLLLRRGDAGEARQAFIEFAQTAAGRNQLKALQATSGDGKSIDYFVTGETLPDGKLSGEQYIFTTDSFAPDTAGYGGPVTLAVVLDADGTLRDVTVIQSQETPAYLEYLRAWMKRLPGHNLFDADPLKDVDAVTGATLTSTAVLRILRNAGPGFAGKVLGRSIGPGAADVSHRVPYREAAWLALTIAAALALRTRPSRWARRTFLLLIVLLSGFVFNMQYSLAHVFSLLGLAIPPFGPGAAILLVAGIPVLVALFGNIYCGYLCPFGALQELVGDLRPASIQTDPGRMAWACGRLVKYLLLFFFVLLFAASFETATASSDPLVTMFSNARGRVVIGLAVVLTGLAFFYPRFWCRTLCPAGAFLALLGGIRLFGRFMPPVNPRACVYGVRDGNELDCLSCDRCRRPGRQEQAVLARATDGDSSRPVDKVLLVTAVVLAAMLAAQAAVTWHTGLRAGGARARAATAGGGARPVDVRLLLQKIQQGRLSGHEALFYTNAPGPSAGVGAPQRGP